jgi:hypothetical protein
MVGKFRATVGRRAAVVNSVRSQERLVAPAIVPRSNARAQSGKVDRWIGGAHGLRPSEALLRKRIISN